MRDKERARSDVSDANSNEDAVLPKSSFITTSDVLNQLNRQLSDLSAYDVNESVRQQQKSRFELQKRLPDGSTIPATNDEIAASDFKNKLEQSAKFISELKSPEERQSWVEDQRLTGNSFFQQGDYKGAMDIYLTCLVVKENTPDFVRDTFLPVLNNLAQCTLQLGMHMKTILFCEMALEEVSKSNEQVTKSKINQEEQKTEKIEFSLKKDLKDAIALCKIFFKLGKALRLTGHYGKAREALNNSLDCLIGEKNETIASSLTTSGDTDKPQFSLVPYKNAIKREYRYLDIAENEAKRNLARQKRAMQTVLSSSLTTKSNFSATKDESKIGEISSTSNSLYETSSEPRQFSKLRVQKCPASSSAQREFGTDSNGECELEDPSYTQYYWSMVARVAKSLLVMLGDDNDIDNGRVPKFDLEQVRTGKKHI